MNNAPIETNAATETVEDDDTYAVDDLQHFVLLLQDWHTSNVKRLEQLLTIPEGSEVSLDTEEPITLEGEVRQAFVMGVTIALMALGTLPFAAEYEDLTNVVRH